MKVVQLFEKAGKTAGGWTVVDKSFTTKGADPTEVSVYKLSKDGVVVKVTEFSGDWSWEDNRGNESKGPLTGKQIDQFLLSIKAPNHAALTAMFDEPDRLLLTFYEGC